MAASSTTTSEGGTEVLKLRSSDGETFELDAARYKPIMCFEDVGCGQLTVTGARKPHPKDDAVKAAAAAAAAAGETLVNEKGETLKKVLEWCKTNTDDTLTGEQVADWNVEFIRGLDPYRLDLFGLIGAAFRLKIHRLTDQLIQKLVDMIRTAPPPLLSPEDPWNQAEFRHMN